MSSKYIALFLLCVVLVGCGGQVTPKPAPTPTTTSTQDFPAATPDDGKGGNQWICQGDPFSTGEICDQGDGTTYYHHVHEVIQVASGSFKVVEESGYRTKAQLQQIVVSFPQDLFVTNMHSEQTVITWCPVGQTFGYESGWDGVNENITVFQGIDSKGAFTTQVAPGEQHELDPQDINPNRVLKGLIGSTYVDLCSTGTINWTITGSFTVPTP